MALVSAPPAAILQRRYGKPRRNTALNPLGRNWQESIKPPPVKCEVAGGLGCDTHTLDASRLWCDYSCPLQSHYSSVWAESQRKLRFLDASYEKPTRLCAILGGHTP